MKEKIRERIYPIFVLSAVIVAILIFLAIDNEVMSSTSVRFIFVEVPWIPFAYVSIIGILHNFVYVFSIKTEDIFGEIAYGRLKVVSGLTLLSFSPLIMPSLRSMLFLSQDRTDQDEIILASIIVVVLTAVSWWLLYFVPISIRRKTLFWAEEEKKNE